MKRIHVVVEEDGSIAVDMDGYQDESCARDLDRFKKKLESRGVRIVAGSEIKKATGQAVRTTGRHGISQ
jgi:hypothetical protein